MAKARSATSVVSLRACSSPESRASGPGLTETALSLAMLTALALVAGAVFLWRKGERQRPALMAILAAVMITNVVIWSLPTSGGQTLTAAAAPTEGNP